MRREAMDRVLEAARHLEWRDDSAESRFVASGVELIVREYDRLRAAVADALNEEQRRG